MLPEQQQRIMGYFIEEAKDHLNTIEQGLLNLQGTISDPEMMNEIFRAAHSVKGGAAMLGISSIQKTAHRLEDYFKVLKEEERPIQVDQKLESLFLKVFDTLRDLLDQLQGPFGLSEDAANGIMANTETVFDELHTHLESLVGVGGTSMPMTPVTTATPAAATPTHTPATVFQTDVPLKLRDLLQLFKQPETATTRQQLQGVCSELKQIGEKFNLSSWCELVDIAHQVIGNSNNPYRALAPLVIKELKQAQDLIIANRSTDVFCSEKLRELLPLTPAQDDFSLGLFTDLDTDSFDSTASDLSELTAAGASVPATANPFDLASFMSSGSDDLSQDLSGDISAMLDEQPGPEVGIAELNSLADLFEGEALDLGSTWQEEEVLGEMTSPNLPVSSSSTIETPNDFSDLLDGDMSGEAEPPANEVDDLVNLFGDDFLLDEQGSGESAVVQSDPTAHLDDLLDSMPMEEPVSTRVERAPSALDNLGDLFGGVEEEDLPEVGSETDALLDELEFRGLESSSTDAFASSVDSQPDTEGDFWSGLDAEPVTADVSGETDLSSMGAAFDSLETSDLTSDFGTDLDLSEFVTDEPAIASEAETSSGLDLDDLFGPDEAVSSDANLEQEESIETWLGNSNEATEDYLSGSLDDLLGEDLAPEAPVTEASGLESGLDELASLDFVGPTNLNADDLSLADLNVDQIAPDLTTGFDDSLVQSGDDLAVDIDFDALPETEPAAASDADDLDVLGLGLFDSEPDTLQAPDLETSFDTALEDLGLSPETPVDTTAEVNPLDDLELGELSLDTPTAASDFEDLDMGGLDLGPTAANELDDLNLDDLGLGALDATEASTSEALGSLESDLFGSETTEVSSLGDLDMDSFLGDIPAETESLDSLVGSASEVTDTAGLDDFELESFMDFPDSGTSEPETAEIAAPPPVEVETTDIASAVDEFDDLEALLETDTSFVPDTTPPPVLETPPVTAAAASDLDDFADLEALLGDVPAPTTSITADPAPTPVSAPSPSLDSEFDDLEKLLDEADKTLGGSPTVKATRGATQQQRSRRPPAMVDQNMRVPVKQLDNLSNLVGELVVNRNSLEQDQERLRQFLDNLLYQVQQLSDVGQRMRDLYERSLLESSLLASRQSYYTSGNSSQTSHSTGASFDALEMDRFTGFHSLSQEMIELIVRVRESASDIEFIIDETDQVTRNFRQVTTQLQEGLNRARMMPFSQTAERLPRGVRDNAIEYGKQAELIIEGRETLIDKMILEKLVDPLTHLVNNAVAHGIERPEARQAAGKPPVGKIIVRAFYQGNQTVISVSDDGAGIDPERIKAKAIEKGLISQAEARTMSRLDVYEILFLPGFSGADQVTKIAGRGVGMDVVRTNLNEIRGAISIDSTIGKGTTFTIRLPLTLSISKALCCISNRARIAFPMDGVEDMLDVPKERIQTNPDGQPCILWRDMMLPFRSLSEVLKYSRYLGRGSVYGGNQEDDIVSIVVLRSAGNFIALQVDQVLGEQEIVIKQLEGPIPKPVGVAGATVLGDGRIMPIADVLELIDLVQGRIRQETSSKLWSPAEPVAEPPVAASEPTVLIVDDSITVRELLSMTFNKVGYRVEQARDGQEAWEKLRSGLPCDMVFCDIEMPRMDGLELLSRIQKDPILNQLPIAMLTSRGADRHRQMAIQLGARGYFTKPYLEEALLDAAQRMLKGEVLVTAGG